MVGVQDEAGLRHGEEYTFILDEQSPLPDPGVHVAAGRGVRSFRFYDHSLFAWTDDTWQQRPLSSAVIYELHIGTFTPEGTFAGAEDTPRSIFWTWE